jgi:hypothetical protein
MGEGEGTDPHEQVVSSLMDLQSRLRGDPPAAPGEPEDPAEVDELVVVPEAGSTGPQPLTPPDPNEAEEREGFAPVTALHTGAAPEDRFADLAERLSHLERSLAEVSALAERRENERSDRMIALEQRLLHEVASHRHDLVSAVDDRLARLEEALREGLAELRRDPSIVEREPDEPA